jgi:gliding motility-associated-like protein
MVLQFFLDYSIKIKGIVVNLQGGSYHMSFRFIRALGVILLCTVWGYQAKASHIMGGTVTYKYLGNNKYAISFILYQDCANSSQALPSSLTYYVVPKSVKLTYAKIASSISPSYSHKVNMLGKVTSVSAANAACGSSYCTNRGVYNDTITEGTDTSGYYIYTGNSARNGAISNLTFKTNAFGIVSGMTLETYIPPRGTVNNSPEIVKDMTPSVCIGKTNVFNAGIYDPDGDSLVFSFVNPLEDWNNVNTATFPNFPTLSFKSGYSLTYPFGTSGSPIVMDSTTGIITAVIPNKTTAYVVSVMVQDWRVDKLTHKAKLMGHTRVDIEFVAVNCGARPAPKFLTDSYGLKRTVNVGEPFCINLKTTDTSYSGTYDTMTITAASATLGDVITFPKPWATFTSKTATKKDSATYCWTPTCSHITYSSPHTVTFTVADRSCNVVQETYSIYVKPRAYVKPPVLRCVDILGSQYIRLQWDATAADTNFKQYDIYRAKFGNGVVTDYLVKTISNRTTTTWTDSTAFDAQDSSYRYYIGSMNTCGDEGYLSDTLISVIVKGKTVPAGGMEFDWNAVGTSYKDSFAVYADTSAGMQLVDVVNAEKYTFPYCNKKIKVQVKGRSKYTSCLSESNITPQYNLWDTVKPTKMPVVVATVVSWGEIDLIYTKTTSPDIDHYTIYRSVNGGAYAPIDSVFSFGSNSTLLYQDKKATPNTNSYCYKVVAVDHCGNRQVYDPHCVIKSRIKPLQRGLQISWSPYSGFTPDSVKVQQYSSSKWITRKIANITDTTWSDTGITCAKRTYRILAYKNTGSITTISDSIAGTPIDTVLPNVPAWSLISYDKTTTNQINISFKTSGNNDVAGYKLYSWINDTLQTIPTSLTVVSNPGTLSSTPSVSGIKKYCYDYVAIDSCGNLSKIKKHCAIELNGSKGNLMAYLNWTKLQEPGVIKYYIERNNTGTWASVDSALSTDSTRTNSGLGCNVSYTYRIKASLPGGIYSYSNQVTITPFDTIKPQQVNIRSVTVLDNTTNQITFDKVLDPVVTKYIVYVSKNGGTYSLLTTFTKPATFPMVYKHTGINTQKDSFDYQVFAVDSCANNTSATTQTHQPVLLKGDSADYAAVLKWSAYKGFSVKNYVLEYYSGGWKTLATLAGNITSFTDSPIPCVKKYYRIRVVPVSGSESPVSDSVMVHPFDTIKPAAPVIQYATVTGFKSILIKWTKSASNDVRRYDVYRQKSGTASLSYIKTLGDVDNYTDSVKTDSGVSYCYAVKAVDSCANNNSVFSATHCVVNLKADSSTCIQKIFVSWTAYSGWSGGVNKYLLYRKVESTGADTLIATLPATTFSYVDSAMRNTRSYCYKIVAVQNAGINTSSSNYSCSKIYQIVYPQIFSASKITTSLTNGTIVVKWNSVKGQRYYKYYQLYYKPATGLTYTLLQNNIPIGTDSFVHTGLNTQSLDHNYYLVIVDSCGNKTVNSRVHQTMILTITVGQLIHNISWTPYQGFDLKYYVVQRFEKGKFVNVDTVSPAKIKDVIFPAPCNYNIFYRIQAMDSFGHYAWSDTVGKRAIDAIPSNKPTFQNATVLNASQVQLNFLGADSTDTYAYAVQRATNGSWATAGKVLFTTKHAAMQYIDAVNTEKDQHCYTIITLDSCLNASPSDTFCTITLTGTPLDDQNRLNWTKFKGYGMKNYTVLRLINNSWVPLSVLTNKDTTLLHDSLHCYLPQYYKIMGTETSGGSNRITYSDSIQLIPYHKKYPVPAQLQYSSVQPDGSVKLLWKYNTRSNVKYFEVWRKVNSGSFKNIRVPRLVFDSTYIDKGVNVHKDTISYYVISIDSCNDTLRSVPSDTDRMVVLRLHTGACYPMIHLGWMAYQSLPGGTDSFTVFRTIGTAPFTKLKSVAGNILSLDDLSVSPGTKYTYKIQARSKGNKLVSMTDTFSLSPIKWPAPDTARIVYTTVVKTGVTDGVVHLKWTPEATTDTFARGYIIYDGDPVTNTYTQVYKTNNIKDTSVTLTGVNTLNKGHRYKLVVFNLCNVEGNPGKIHQPVFLQVKDNYNLTTLLTWTGYKGQIVKGVDIYRSEDNGSLQLIASKPVWDTTYLDTNIVCQHSYTYLIETRLFNGYNSYSDSVSLVVHDTVAPAKAKLYVISTDTTSKSGGKISLRWYGNKKPSRKGYNIYRQVNNGYFSLYFTLNTIKTDTVYWQDQNLNTLKNTYSYYITALDSCGNESMPIDTHTVVHLAVKPVSQYMQLNWTPYRGFKAWKYILEKRTLTSVWQSRAIFSSNISSFRDSTVTCHVYYLYRIRYVDANGQLFGFSNLAGDTAIDTVAPKISQFLKATVVQTGSTTGAVELDWNPSSSNDVYGYLIDRSTDGKSWVSASGGLIMGTTFNDNNLNTYGQPYYYRITPVDSCGNVARGYSAVHETIRLKTLPGNQQVKLWWNKYKGWTVKSYNIYRDGILLTTLPKDSSKFVDTVASCKITYHYKVEAVADSSIAISAFSNIDSAHPYDHIAPDKVYVRSASIDVAAGKVVLSWDPVKAFDVKNYYIYRKTAKDGQMIFIDSTDKTVYFEDFKHIHGPDCYYVFARDYCRNQSDGSNRACLIILKGQNIKDHNVLTWNQYADWPDGIKEYRIYKNEDSTGWMPIGTNSNALITYEDKYLTSDIIDYCYQVEAVENDGKYNATSKSTVVCLHRDPVLYVPDAFTPATSTGLNDSFGPKGMFIKNYEMSIYNRWGELIYKASNGQWDGKYQGTIVPSDVYKYIIKVEGYNETISYYKGNVIILY